MKKKLIFISSYNYDSLLFDKFDLQNFIDSTKIDTELWKLDFKNNDIINKNNNVYYKSKLQESELKKEIKIIKNYIDLIKLIKTTNNNCFIFDFDFIMRNPFFSLITKLNGARLIFHGLAQFPIVEIKTGDLKNKLKSIKIKDLFYFFLKFLKFLYKKIVFYLFSVKLDIFFYNGIFEKKNSNKISKKSIGLFTRDYDRYLKENNNNSSRLVKEDYILFIDMGYPIPYDNYFSEEKPVTSAEEYNNAMLKLLNSVQKYFQKKIVVALHPRSNKTSFNNFESYKGQTDHLVKHSYFVVAHDSLSLQFVALWNKPCLLLYNNDMINRLTKKKEINWFIEKMNLQSLNIDKFDNDEIKSKIDFINMNLKKNYYEKFINEFIIDHHVKKQTTSNSMPELIIEEICKYQ